MLPLLALLLAHAAISLFKHVFVCVCVSECLPAQDLRQNELTALPAWVGNLSRNHELRLLWLDGNPIAQTATQQQLEAFTVSNSASFCCVYPLQRFKLVCGHLSAWL